ncbi:hypothetical protein BTM74_18570 [Salmonella enterica]|nr:hypothetical protein [Salmonella enterica]
MTSTLSIALAENAPSLIKDVLNKDFTLITVDVIFFIVILLEPFIVKVHCPLPHGIIFELLKTEFINVRFKLLG